MKRSQITFCGISKKSVKEKKKKKGKKEIFWFRESGVSLLREPKGPTKGPVERTKNREGRKRKVTGSVTRE
jgi:hypothetical protein